MPLLTVFTPAYNRAYTLPRTYESMCNQTCKDFVWMIIDDGSTDNTAELVKAWQKKDNGFEIIYIYKENGGMHTAHNTAYENITTELNTCIDSDDAMPDNAVEIIVNLWREKGGKNYAGIIGLDAKFDGTVIGTKFPDNIGETTLGGFYSAGGKGDKKLVYRTDIMKAIPPYPVFKGEKYVYLSYKYGICDRDYYPLLTTNEVLCNVEYQEDGSSVNMFRQYYTNPNGFAFMRKNNLKYSDSILFSVKECIHYVSSSFIGKNRRFIMESPKKVLTVLAIPPGYLFSRYIIYKVKHNHKLKLEKS